MRVAAAYDNGNVFHHFGMTSEFKFYEIEDGKVVSTEIRDTGGAKHRDIVFFLKDSGVDTLICGGIGGCGQRLLAENGIRLLRSSLPGLLSAGASTPAAAITIAETCSDGTAGRSAGPPESSVTASVKNILFL